MNDFTASNGFRVGPHPTRSMGFAIFDEDGENTLDNSSSHLNTFELDALREYFRAKEDERLGRWRWPENPDYTVYHWDQPQGAGVVVVSETEMVPSRVIYRDSDPENLTPEYRAARAYFDAHPEPKPWHDAKTGEVWVLNMPAGPVAAVVRLHYGLCDYEGNKLNLARVASGRRIWPEVSE